MGKYLSRIIYTILFIAGACVIYSGLYFVAVYDIENMTRITFHDFYNAEKNIDYFFMGTSHGARCIDAVTLTENLEKEVFNGSISAMDFKGGYFMLKDAVKHKNIDTVYFELSYSRFYRQKSMEYVYIIADYMKSFPTRAEYIMATTEPEEYVNSFFKVRRNIDPVTPPSLWYIKNYIIDYKLRDDYWNREGYYGKGWWPYDRTWQNDDGTFCLYIKKLKDKFTLDEMDRSQLVYLDKIIELCEKKDINLVFYILPYTEYYFKYVEGYEDVRQVTLDEISKYGTEVIDLNLAKDEYLNLENKDFLDADHISLKGSEKITAFLTMYLKNPDGDYFYDTIEEKYPRRDGVLAVLYDKMFITDDGRFEFENEVTANINFIELTIGAEAYEDIPVNVNLFKVSVDDDENSIEEAIPGEKIDEYYTMFTVPYDNYSTLYKVQLIDPATNVILYEANSYFDLTVL